MPLLLQAWPRRRTQSLKSGLLVTAFTALIYLRFRREMLLCHHCGLNLARKGHLKAILQISCNQFILTLLLRKSVPSILVLGNLATHHGFVLHLAKQRSLFCHFFPCCEPFDQLLVHVVDPGIPQYPAQREENHDGVELWIVPNLPEKFPLGCRWRKLGQPIKDQKVDQIADKDPKEGPKGVQIGRY